MTAVLVLVTLTCAGVAQASEPVRTSTRAHFGRTPVSEDQRAVLKVRVASTMPDPPDGRVVVFLEGHQLARRAYPRDGSALVVRFPPLSRGSYVVEARFYPSGADRAVTPSSTSTKLKVVRDRS